MQLSKYTASS